MGFPAAKILCLLFRTPFGTFAKETFYLVGGPRSYLNGHGGPRTKMSREVLVETNLETLCCPLG